MLFNEKALRSPIILMSANHSSQKEKIACFWQKNDVQASVNGLCLSVYTIR